MKKKIMMIGMSVLMTMTGLKAQQEILDKNDFFDGRTWTVVDTVPVDLDMNESNLYSKQGEYRKEWIKKNQYLIGTVFFGVVTPLVVLIATITDDSYSESGGSNGCRLANTIQCSGIAKSTGQQCQRQTTDCSGRCHDHR
jgi:hypothetical protein